MKSLQSVTFWIVIFLVFILLFMHYKQKLPPDQISILEWQEMGAAGLIKSAVDHEGLIDGQYIKAPRGADGKVAAESSSESYPVGEYEAKYLYPGQSDQVLIWAKDFKMPAGGHRYDTDPKNQIFSQILITVLLPMLVLVVLWMLLMRQTPGRRQQGHELRQEPRQAGQGRRDQDHLQGRGRRRRGARGTAARSSIT